VTSPRTLERIVATTDVHSAFDHPAPLLTHLHTARANSLIVDCGDFFEGTGYYRLGGGTIERQALTRLYDVIAPGNHGWPHHFEPDLHALTVCANAVDHATGEHLFRRLHLTEIGGRRVAITAVIGEQAFHAIPFDQRIGHRVTDPVQALRAVLLTHHHEADTWILLSHSGFDQDLKVAAACPFLDIIFAGHCHSDQYAPVHVGDTLVLKGRELGAGYALAEPVGSGWAAHTCTFPPAATMPAPLKPLAEEIGFLGRRLTAPLGRTAAPFRNVTLDRRTLLTTTAERLRTGLGADAVLLNETCLRTTPLGEVLRLGDLLAIEPFANHLVHAQVPEDLPSLLPLIAEQTGPLVSSPDPLPPVTRSVLTTEYLADTYLSGRHHEAGLRLNQALRHVLTDPSGGTR
jgi:2',3'-cyclic-nucleotide 2'-phosphodiesterase (5'-nucleotidase family)